MDKILIVFNDKEFANKLQKKISISLDCECDVAYNLQEVKLFTKVNNYFLILCSTNLTDDESVKTIDYLTSKKLSVIAIAQELTNESRKAYLEKNIIDIIDLDDSYELEYITSNIKRLHNNKNFTILVVEDSLVVRKQIQNFLQNLFINVYAVSHGEEALGMLASHPEISLVLTDYHMPVMDGLELTKEIRKTYSKHDLSIMALSSESDSSVNAMFLKSGANDYIKKPFSKEEFSCRINNALEAIENIQIITSHANRDYLTGLYNRRYFYNDMQEYINTTNDGEKFALAIIDIDNFKSINDTNGHDAGDKAIIDLSEILRSNTNRRDLVSRFGGEEFCVVLKNINRYSAYEIYERLRSEVQKELNFTISIGAVIHDKDDTLDESISNADMLLYKAKQNGKNQVVFE